MEAELTHSHMDRLTIILASSLLHKDLEAALRSWANKQNAEVAYMGPLGRHGPRSMHWHIRRLEKGSGTVEATYVPNSGMFEVVVHTSRSGRLAGTGYPTLASSVRRSLEDRRR